MQKNFFNLFGAFAAAILLWSACTKPNEFGAELLEGEIGNYIFTDTVTVQCTVEQEDSIVTSDRSATSDYFLCGKIVDPVFGTHEAEIFSLLTLGSFNPNFSTVVDKSSIQLDSVILYLQLDGKGIYGDTTQLQTLKVYRLNSGEQVRWDSAYYSTQNMAADEEIGSAQIQIHPNRKVPLIFGEGASRDSIGAANWVRVVLNPSFGQELLGLDSTKYRNDTLFWQHIRGLKFKLETPDPRAFAAFDLNVSNFSRISLFYNLPTDSMKQDSRRYSFVFSAGNKFIKYGHNYAGSEAGNAIGKADNDLLFLQGMGGLKVRLDFPHAQSFQNIVVNQAMLELTAAQLPNDNINWYAPAGQLLLRDTSRDFITDVYYSAGSSFNLGFANFGGTPAKVTVDDKEVYRYQMLLSQRFQEMVDQKPEDKKGTRLYMNVFTQFLSPGRTVFYGQKSTTFPAKLKLKYTKL